MFFVSVPQYFSIEPKKVNKSTSQQVNKCGGKISGIGGNRLSLQNIIYNPLYDKH